MIRFTRSFHAVGQGAFYSEDIEQNRQRIFRMVYDCGSLTLKKAELKKRIESDFAGDLNVDLLFISHFDQDHVNGVTNLKPQTVILPFLSRDLVQILKIYNSVVENIYNTQLAEAPESIFQNARIIKVLPEDPETNNEGPNELTINIGNEDNQAGSVENVKSKGSIIISDKRALWEYIPLNPNWNKYIARFKAEVKKHNLDWNKLIALPNEQYIRDNINDLKSIYDKLSPKNEHSLVVYSNSLSNTNINYYWSHFLHKRCFCRFLNRLPFGCLYFGDITIKDIWRDPFYDFLRKTGRLSQIGTVQIPHHGSYLSHGEEVYSTTYPFDSLILCIISVGESNKHGHPSLHVINELQRNCGTVVMVTEAVSSLCTYYSYCP